MRKHIDLEEWSTCCGCSACAQACPKGCITMQADGEGFLYPVIDENTCIACGACEHVCPIKNTSPEPTGEPDAYAAYSKNTEQRLESSSGGVFSLLAEEILQNSGVVFGAAMSEDCRKAQHIAVERQEDLWKLRGSKYLQSEIGSTYRQAENALKQGRRVLFSGTPCEIEGLHRYLRREYENLLCVDLICHGVPSAKLWEKYVSYRENCAGAAAQRTFFRHKKYGWKTYAVLFEFANNTAYEQVLSKDLFMQMFLQNLCLRPSCYACAFKKKNRVSDITLADFWGCDSVCPELDDDKGLSLVLIHSKTGVDIWKGIKDAVDSRAVNLNDALKGNIAYTRSCAMPPQRNLFMKDIDTLEIPELAKKYLVKPNFVSIIKQFVPVDVKRRIKHISKCLIK